MLKSLEWGNFELTCSVKHLFSSIMWTSTAQNNKHWKKNPPHNLVISLVTLRAVHSSSVKRLAPSSDEIKSSWFWVVIKSNEIKNYSSLNHVWLLDTEGHKGGQHHRAFIPETLHVHLSNIDLFIFLWVGQKSALLSNKSGLSSAKRGLSHQVFSLAG